MKIVTVVGARPQFVKVAPVSRALRQTPNVTEIVIHTGQHYDDVMSGIFFRELDIAPPAYNVDVRSGSHGQQTGMMLQTIEELLQGIWPDLVLVYGDTNSTLAGALAAAKLNLPVAHVEAGLRSYNRQMPEEVNRVVTDHLSSIHFAPSPSAVANLRAEGIDGDGVLVTGDVMLDATKLYTAKAGKQSNVLRRLNLSEKRFALATIHRVENTDNASRLRSIWRALDRLAATECPVVLPLHPRTLKMIGQLDLIASSSMFHVLEPLGYLDMLRLEASARVIVTDSGGVQKEAYFQGVPCVTLRRETEWTELVSSGWNRLVRDLNESSIYDAAVNAYYDPEPAVAPEFYGDGNASRRIADYLQTWEEHGLRGDD